MGGINAANHLGMRIQKNLYYTFDRLPYDSVFRLVIISRVLLPFSLARILIGLLLPMPQYKL